MKRILVLMIVVLLAALLAACGTTGSTTTESAAQTTEAPKTTAALTTPQATTPAATTAATTPVATPAATTPAATTPAVTTAGKPENALPDYVDGKLFIIEDGKTNYQVVFPLGANKSGAGAPLFADALSSLRKAFKTYGLQLIAIKNDSIPLGEEDTFVAPAYEILVGDTNRAESDIVSELAFNEAVIRVVGKKVVIVGANNSLSAKALLIFIEKYMPEDGKAVLLPADLNEKIEFNMEDCIETGLTYAEMANNVLASFNKVYWENNYVKGSWWWDAAEMLETYVDVYERLKFVAEKTKAEADVAAAEAAKKQMLAFADQFVRNHTVSWRGNDFNDDIMWACIGFSRITMLTGDAKYAGYAKRNFDAVWSRAWDNKLGGGLYWKTDNTTKNSCVNCPAAIAACLLGEINNDEAYFEKAKKIMTWEIEWMFEKATGKVYDAYPLVGEIGKWSSTYNQGTFIGACTLLAKHYEDQTYLIYAQKAADFAMKNLTRNGILDNGEGNPSADNRDLPGFKGILTRWLYRYAKEVNNVEILTFLQTNAATAYNNRNADGLIWTTWVAKTPDDATNDINNYIAFGMSTALALMFNCQQWW